MVLLTAACGANATHPTTTRDPFRAGNEEPLACVPNLDGKIEAREMAPTLGATAHFLVSPDGKERTVDLVGRIDAGRRLWDWSRGESSDQLAALAASKLAGKWYAESFPADVFVAPLDAGATTEGVYRHTPDALLLLGVASTKQDPAEGRTLLVYDAPVQLYRFPLETGANWISSGTTRDAMLRGLPYAGRDTYDVRVDAAGDLALPDLEFTQALRVRMHITLEPAVGVSVSRRQVSFVSECFGEVARATSRLGEDAEDFTIAAEVRRLGLSGS